MLLQGKIVLVPVVLLVLMLEILGFDQRCLPLLLL